MRLHHLVLERCVLRRCARRGAVLLVVAGLVACGGGSGETPPPSPPSPPPAPQPAEQESDEGISGAVWFALGGAALLAGAAAGALIFWRKRQGKG